MTRVAAWVLLAMVAVACAPTFAAAEWNVDVYGGAAWPDFSDVDVHAQTGGVHTHLNISDMHVDTGFIVGGRGGYWFDSFPYLGLDLDVFYLQAHVPSQEQHGSAEFNGKFLGKPISVDASGNASISSGTLPLFGFAPELRARWPLMVDADFPAGRLQPYLDAGPTWAFSLNDDSLKVEFGGKVGAGVAYNIVPMFAIFGEYRYTFYPGFNFTGSHATYTTDIDAHALLVGGSLRF